MGDYAKKTAHLSLVEDGVYGRLIRKYYISESPLPRELPEVYRIAGARTAAERTAVKRVLEEFFELRDDGWHNKRCDEEIERYRAGEPEREAKRENDRDRQRRSRERRAQLFNELRTLGQVPSYDSTTSELERLLSRHHPANGHDSVTPKSRDTSHHVTCDNTASHPPVPILQSPSSSPQIPISEHSLKSNYEAFEVVRRLYPPKSGREDWITAQRNFNQRISDGITPELLIEGVKRYAAYCNGGGVDSNKFVLSATRFFGDVDQPWSQPWNLPIRLEAPRPRAKTAEELMAEGRDRA